MIAIQAVHLDDELEELATRQLVIQIGLVGHIAEELTSLEARSLEAADTHGPRAGSQQPANHLDRRRLARAVGPEEGEQLTRADFQVEPVNGTLGPEPLGYPGNSIMMPASQAEP